MAWADPQRDRADKKEVKVSRERSATEAAHQFQFAKSNWILALVAIRVVAPPYRRSCCGSTGELRPVIAVAGGGAVK